MKQGVINIYKHRALVDALVARELKARYRSSLLGVLWSFLNPLLLMAVYAIVFTQFLRFGMPKYASFLLSGLLPWIWFSTSINEATVSIVSGGNLIKKVMFPADVLPLVSVVTNLVHYLLSLVILIPFVLLYGAPTADKVIASPVDQAWSNPVWLVLSFLALLVIEFVFTFGLALGLSALTVHLRDIQHIVMNLLTLWFFASPIIYPMVQVPERFREIALRWNPMAYLITSYHKVFICGVAPSGLLLLIMFCVSLLVLWLGYLVFEKFRDSFAEEV